MEGAERELARPQNLDVGVERDSWLVLRGTFAGDGWGQGCGYAIDDVFLKRLMAVFKAESLQDCNGKPCWLTHTSSSILKIEPLFPGEGTTFDVQAWSDEARNLTPKVTPKERKP